MDSTRQIVVFGGGDWARGDGFWDLGVSVGRLLARYGFVTVTGGYGGAMEAVSEGAREEGGKTIGVLHSPPAVKPPNPYVERTVPARDYLDRLGRLLRIPRAIALPGGSGTFAEIAVSLALADRQSGRSLAIWKPWWFDRLAPHLSGETPGVTWVGRLDEMDRWLKGH